MEYFKTCLTVFIFAFLIFGFFLEVAILEFWTSYGSVWTIYQGDQEVLGVALKEVFGEKCVLIGKNQV